MTRRHFAALALGSAARGRPSGTSRAIAWLWDQQAPDGGWHSATYGLLRTGDSLTGFILDTLLKFDPPSRRVERALAFLESRMGPEGAIGWPKSIAHDYPNYATALAVKAFCRAGRHDRTAPMTAYLRSRQFAGQNQWTPAAPAFGAWGMGGPRLTPPHTGHIDLSMTRHVLEALRAAGAPASDEAIQQSRVFLDRLRNQDGGYCFSTVVADANKAGDGKSYGSATADAVLAARAAASDETSAAGWLRRNYTPDSVPGFEGESREVWTRGLFFYYAATASAALGVKNESVLRLQGPDGSFANREPLVKEDDPLIATVFAIEALNPGGRSW